MNLTNENHKRIQFWMKLEKQEERFKKLFYYPRSFNQFLFPHPHTLSPYPAARTRLRPHSLPPSPHSGSLESRVREGEVEPPLGGIRQHRQPPQSLEKFCNPPKDNLFGLIFFNCSGKCFLAQCPARVGFGQSRSEKWRKNVIHSFREVQVKKNTENQYTIDALG